MEHLQQHLLHVAKSQGLNMTFSKESLSSVPNGRTMAILVGQKEGDVIDWMLYGPQFSEIVQSGDTNQLFVDITKREEYFCLKIFT